MADNLLETAVRQLGPSGLAALGNALGLPEGQSEPAVSVAAATVLAGMLNKGSSKTGMASVFNMVTGSGGMGLSSAADTFSDPPRLNSLQKSGGNMLEGIFGSQQVAVTDLLSAPLRVSGDTGGSLLRVAAPIVVSLLGQLTTSKDLDIGGLALVLLGQKPFIKDWLPEGLLKELGVSSFDRLGAALETHGHAEPQTAHLLKKKTRSFDRWFWPLLIALTLLYVLNMCARTQQVERKREGAMLREERVILAGRPYRWIPGRATGTGKTIAAKNR